MSRFRFASVCAAALTVTMSLSACGSKAEHEEADGQIIGRLGGEDITVAELNREFQVLKVPADKRDDATVKIVLTEMAARKYLTQQAIAAKVDREPSVHLDIERAREELLAGVIAQRQLMMKVQTISTLEISQFIEANPDQFANRKMFEIEQIAFAPQADMNVGKIVEGMKGFLNLDQVAAALDKQGIKSRRSKGSLDSATLPANVEAMVKARKTTNVFFTQAQGLATFFAVISETPAPPSSEAAQKRAKDKLGYDIAMQSKDAAFDAGVKNTKFVGDYARIMSAPVSPAGTDPAAPVETTAKPPVESPAKP